MLGGARQKGGIPVWRSGPGLLGWLRGCRGLHLHVLGELRNAGCDYRRAASPDPGLPPHFLQGDLASERAWAWSGVTQPSETAGWRLPRAGPAGQAPLCSPRQETAALSSLGSGRGGTSLAT